MKLSIKIARRQRSVDGISSKKLKRNRPKLRFRWLVVFLFFVELQAPTITPAFSSPLHVVEGETVTLEWTYNLHGVAFFQTQFALFQGGGFVVSKTRGFAAFITSGFRGRITVNITESFASVQFLSINRTDSNTYIMTVTNDDGIAERVIMEIQVQCKFANAI